MYILDRLIAAEYSKSSDRIESITMKYILILHTEKERDFIEQQDRYRRLGGGAGGGETLRQKGIGMIMIERYERSTLCLCHACSQIIINNFC